MTNDPRAGEDVIKEGAMTTSELMCAPPVVSCLRDACSALSRAHMLADEHEVPMGHGDLTGTVRDLIFGLNTAVESLAEMIDEGRFGGHPLPPSAVSAGSLDSDGD